MVSPHRLRTLLSLLLTSCTVSVSAGVVNVPSDFPSIQLGVNAAVNGDTVLVAPGTYLQQVDISGKTVHIISRGGSDSTILNWPTTGVAYGIRFTSGASGTFSGFTIETESNLTIGILIEGPANIKINKNHFRNISVTTDFIHWNTPGALGSLTIDHNVFADIDAPNAMILLGGSYAAQIYNNTIYGTQRGIAAYLNGCTVQNNIISQCTFWGVFSNGFNIIEEYNCFFGNTVDVLNIGVSPMSIQADPQFVGAPGYNFRLLDTSPCINAGNPHPLFKDPDGSRNDIGAFVTYLPVTVTIPDDFTSIQAALDIVGQGSTILLAPGDYSENITIDNKSITLMAEDTNDVPCLVPVDPSLPIISIAPDSLVPVTISISDLCFMNGTLASAIEGSLGVYSSVLTIERCDFINNADGAVTFTNIEFAGMSIVECYFRQCGGDVLSLSAGRDLGVEVQDCHFSLNIANKIVSAQGWSSGGGVSLNQLWADSNVTNGALIDIQGAAFNFSSVTNSVFADNDISGSGLIRLSAGMNGQGYLNKNVFYRNNVPGGGAVIGEIITDGDVVLMENSILFQNTGGLAVRGNTGVNDELDVVDCIIYDNPAGNWNPEIDSSAILSADPLFCDAINLEFTRYNGASLPNAGPFGAGCTATAQVTWLDLADELDPLHTLSATPNIHWSSESFPSFPQDSFDIEVGTDANWSFAEMWDPGAVGSVDSIVTYAGVGLLDGVTYYVRVRTHNTLSWSDWSETSFHMNSRPTTPALASPSNNSVLASENPTLYNFNAFDGDGDQLKYVYEVYADAGLTALVDFDSLVVGQPDSTSWTTVVILQDNLRYWWRVKSTDGFEFSNWSLVRSFYVNSVNSPPLGFELHSPLDSTYVFELPPNFVWGKSTDEDPFDSVKYRLEIALDESFSSPVVYDSITDTVLTLSDSLVFGEEYWWRIGAFDLSQSITYTQSRTFSTWLLGDASGDGAVNIGDVTFLIARIFSGGPAPNPLKAGDVNGDCKVNIGDVTYLVARIFAGGPAPVTGCAE